MAETDKPRTPIPPRIDPQEVAAALLALRAAVAANGHDLAILRPLVVLLADHDRLSEIEAIVRLGGLEGDNEEPPLVLRLRFIPERIQRLDELTIGHDQAKRRR